MSGSCPALVFLLFALPAFAQSQTFAAISIKPARSDDPRNMRMRVLSNGDLSASAVPVLNWTDLPVVNRTALSGLFAVATDGWTPMRLPPPPPGNPPGVRFDDLPSIFTVLRKLGLELKQQEATVPAYTVEHIEPPSGE